MDLETNCTKLELKSISDAWIVQYWTRLSLYIAQD
jgi:hypothetical protein